MALTQEQLGFLEEMMYETIGDCFLSIGQKKEKLKEFSQPFISEDQQIVKIKEYVVRRVDEEAKLQADYEEKKMESEIKEQEYNEEKDKIK